MSSSTTRYASSVPTEPLQNLVWRRHILQKSFNSKRLQADLLGLCRQDILTWINSFVWTYNPKEHPDNPVVPFCTYPFQEEALLRMTDAIGNYDILIEKSRDMGASWMCLLVFLWRWLFYTGQTFMIVSRHEALVDRVNDSDSLFWKIMFTLDHLPVWMRPPLHRAKLSLTNLQNTSSIIGSATTGDTARGGRRTAILFDEFAMVRTGYEMLSASRDNTRCRIFNSTPKGTGNAFYDRRQKMREEHRIRLHWPLHPEKNKLLYQAKGGRISMLRGGKLPKGYTPILDGKIRSPWYDNECERATSDQEIAQELDIDYHQSAWQFFSDSVIEDLKPNVMPPIFWGELIDEVWTNMDGGSVKLWCNLVRSEHPPEGAYVIGCDIAAGVGGKYSSRSAASIVNRVTGEKVGEMLTGDLYPSDFAEYVLGLCRWFHRAYLIWEANGAGMQFGKTVVESGYRNFYYRTNEAAIVKKRSSEPGFWSTAKSKRVFLSEYGRALRLGRFINHSGEALQECREYVHHTNGDIIHSSAASAYDPTQKGENHGDIVIADALAWHAVAKNRGSGVKQEEKTIWIPPNSIGGRRLKRLAQEQEARFGWFSSLKGA